MPTRAAASELIASLSREALAGARQRLAGTVLRTPLVRLEVDFPGELWLKLECLQPIGSFKLRGACNAMALADPERLARGVYTASAGNMAQGVAWNARRLGIPCHVVVPESAPRAKLEAIARLGATALPARFDAWWQVMRTRTFAGLEDALFLHPFCDPAVLAANGTIGLEILEDLPSAETVLVPWGGGGLACGIAGALRCAGSTARVLGCEVSTATPLASSLAAGRAVDIDYQPSFVDGIGARGMLPEMWPLAQAWIGGALAAAPGEVAKAVRLLAARARVVAEGAGATALAAALAQSSLEGVVVCVVSGGNIDLELLARILAGGEP